MSITSTATLDPTETYRYELTRTWGPASPLVFCMLNPSTADASTDDPTIRRCVGFAKREGAGGIIVVNLFALRATDPAALRTHPDPLGPDNYRQLGEALYKGRFIAAWGAHPLAREKGARLIHAVGGDPSMWCLGTTKDGSPRHPLYVRGDAPLIPYGAAK